MVAPINPIFTWQDGKLRSPQEVSREREIAEALMFAKPQATGPFGALGQIGSALSGSLLDSRADAYAEQGREAASNLFAGIGSGSSADAISAALLNPAAEWATPAQSGIAEALFNNEIRQSDPAYQLDLQYKQAQLDALLNPQPVMADPTSAMQNYEYLIAQGVDPAQAQTMAFGGGGTSINNYGSIPSGYEIYQDPSTGATQMRPIPGSPQAMEQSMIGEKSELTSNQRDVVTDTIVSEAQKARDAAKGFAATGVGNFVTGGVGFTPAADLNTYIQSLEAIASAENINAMRQASPTGGALGNTSDADLQLLKRKAGALNPQSPNFDTQLDDYERTLLRIVHGPEAGDRIFQETRPPGANAQAIPVGTVEDGYEYLGGPLGDQSSWRKVN